MITLDTNAGPAWGQHAQPARRAARRAGRDDTALSPQRPRALLPLISFGLVVAMSLLSLYVQVLNEQMQRAALFHQNFYATTPAKTTVAQAQPVQSQPSALQTATR